MQVALSLKIKFRESFRPFAPCVLRDRASEIFEFPPNAESPYMLLVAPVRETFRTSIPEGDLRVMENDPDLRRRVKVIRSAFPAITHLDYSARVQTVDAARHGRFYRLLKAFENQTQCPVLVNTSFNVRGEPIVCLPAEALRCFLATDMDALVLEDFLVRKEDIPKEIAASEREQYLATFEPD